MDAKGYRRREERKRTEKRKRGKEEKKKELKDGAEKGELDTGGKGSKTHWGGGVRYRGEGVGLGQVRVKRVRED